jgi:hypothetical protein
MPTSFRAQQRVVHATLGTGTVVEVAGDSVRVELDSDDGARVRTFMASLGTLAAADQPIEHPPTDQIPAQPKALEPKPEPENPTMPDILLNQLEEALASRPRGATKALAAELGIDCSSLNYWRKAGKVPDARRDAVRTWIDKPKILAIRVAKTKPAPKAKPAPKLRLVETSTPPPPIRSAIDHGTVLQALGLTITTAWLPEGETMRQVRVAVLP